MTDTEPEVLARLHEDHERLAKILDLLEALAARYDGARGTELELLAAAVDYIVEYPDAVHHPLEDRVFSMLDEHRLSAEQRRVVSDNAAQHVQLKSETERLLRDIDAVLDGTGSHAAELREHVTEYVAMQRGHMENEQELVFPLALRTLSNDEWSRLDESESFRRDPLFELRISRYDDIYEYLVESP